MTLSQTLRPLFLSTLAGTAAYLTAFLVQVRSPVGLLIVFYVWPAISITAVVLVLPVLAAAPRLRTPSYGVAAVWGALASVIGHTALYYRQIGSAVSWRSLLLMAIPGVIAGVTYAVLARRSKPRL